MYQYQGPYSTYKPLTLVYKSEGNPLLVNPQQHIP